MATRLVVVQRLRSMDSEAQAEMPFVWYSQILGTSSKTSAPAASSAPGPVANSQSAQSPNVHTGVGDTGDPDVTTEESIRDDKKATQEIKVMQDMLRAVPPGELVDVRPTLSFLHVS